MSDVTPKSSASQLWKALDAERRENVRWRRLATAGGSKNAVRDDEVVLPRSDLDALTSELESERARARARDDELRDAREAMREVGVAGGKPAGKPALAELRAAWLRFADTVLNIPTVTVGLSLDEVRLVVASRTDADLYILGLVAPRSETEARQRERVRRALDNPAWLRVVRSPEPHTRRLRVVLLQLAARCYLRPSYYIVYDRSAEQGTLDEIGTVWK